MATQPHPVFKGYGNIFDSFVSVRRSREGELKANDTSIYSVQEEASDHRRRGRVLWAHSYLENPDRLLRELDKQGVYDGVFV